MYFNDIFDNVKPLWRRDYQLSYGNEVKSYILSIGDEYQGVEYIVDLKNKNKYTEWESMLVFTMYRTLTKKGQFYLNNGISDYLNIDEISIEEFEIDYLYNLEQERNEEYLSQYKGLR